MTEVEPNIPFNDLQKIKCPVPMAGGDRDAIKPARILLIFVNIPNACFWIFPAGHATLQLQSNKFNARINEFFAQPHHQMMWGNFDQ